MADYFLKIDGIPGESQDPRHPGEIKLESFCWGESHLAHAGAASAASPAIEDFHVVKYTDKASPLLMLATASGEHFRSAVLTARRPGTGPQGYLTITLSEVMVSSYHIEAPDGQTWPVDRVALSFARIEMAYRPQRPDGTVGAPVTAGWDVMANHKI